MTNYSNFVILILIALAIGPLTSCNKNKQYQKPAISSFGISTDDIAYIIEGSYLASKSALNALVESLAAEGGKMNVRVNAVAPTIIDTPNNRDAMPDQDPSKWVHPGRLSAFMIDLASPDRQDISGAIIPVVGAL